MTDVLETSTSSAVATQVRDLEVRLAEAQQRAARLEAKQAEIRSALIDEAINRSWCDEANDFLEGVGLNRWQVEYEVTITYTTTVSMSGCNDDDGDAQNEAWSRMLNARYDGEVSFDVEKTADNH